MPVVFQLVFYSLQLTKYTSKFLNQMWVFLDKSLNMPFQIFYSLIRPFQLKLEFIDIGLQIKNLCI